MKDSYQNSVIAQLIEAIINETTYEGETNSNIADILLSILEHTEYTKAPRSVIADLLLRLKAKLEGEPFEPYNGAYLGEIAAILISILDESEYTKAPRSRIAELLLELKSKISTVYNATIENGIATFGGVVASQPLVSLLLNIPVTQSGSGTPSPTNIRDFVGVTQAVIGQTSGYGKYFRGLLNGTYGFVDLGTINWTKSSSTTGGFTGTWGDNPTYKYANNTNMICSNYIFDGMGNPTRGYYGDNKTIRYYYTGSLTPTREIYIKDLDKSDYTAVQFKTAMSGVYLIYELAEPSTPVTPQDFAMLCQAFGITGNTYTISFGQTVYSAILDVLNGKLYLTHEIKTIDENSGVQRADNGILFVNSFFEIDEDTESINCNVYQRGDNRGTVAQVSSYNPDLSFCCKLGTNTTRLMIKDTRFKTLEDYQTWLSTNPVKIAVKLAEPIEIQLTPTVINTLIGDNVIFADVADVTECKYKKL